MMHDDPETARNKIRTALSALADKHTVCLVITDKGALAAKVDFKALQEELRSLQLFHLITGTDNGKHNTEN